MYCVLEVSMAERSGEKVEQVSEVGGVGHLDMYRPVLLAEHARVTKQSTNEPVFHDQVFFIL